MTAIITQPCLFTGPALRPGNWPFGDIEPWTYDLIMADPPWRFELWSEKGEGKSPQAHYRTMTIDEIAALPVADLARDDCLLWLWATAPLLPHQLRVMERWGFRYVTMGFWAKKTKNDRDAFGGGYVLRSAGEPFLIGKRGEPALGSKSIRNVINGQVREHSRKPETAYAAAEALMPAARRLDLFSRASRSGWDAWGDEAGKFDGEGSVSLTPADPGCARAGSVVPKARVSDTTAPQCGGSRSLPVEPSTPRHAGPSARPGAGTSAGPQHDGGEL